MNTRIFRRSLIFASLLLVGLAAAPAAFARSHVSIGLGFYGPGYSVGYNNCVNCYYGRTYYSPAYYSGYYYPGYYSAPTYYYNPAPVYYEPYSTYYDPYPAYGTVYYYSGGYRHHRWRGHDRGHYRWSHHDHRWHGH